MFWGGGDSSKLTMEERKTLEELRRLVETGHIIALTPEQATMAVSALKFYAAVTATSGMLAGMRNVFVWIGGALAIWWGFKDAINAYIKSQVGG